MSQNLANVQIADDDVIVPLRNGTGSQFASVLLATVIGVLLGNYIYERRRVTACVVETDGEVTTITPTYGG